MELSHPIAETLRDGQGREMVVRVDAKRRYDATAMAASYGRGLGEYWELKGDRVFRVPARCASSV